MSTKRARRFSLKCGRAYTLARIQEALRRWEGGGCIAYTREPQSRIGQQGRFVLVATARYQDSVFLKKAGEAILTQGASLIFDHSPEPAGIHYAM